MRKSGYTHVSDNASIGLIVIAQMCVCNANVRILTRYVPLSIA